MTSRYGFMTEEEVKQEMEQEKGALDESRKKESERLDPLITDILEDFTAASGFYKATIVRSDGNWSVKQGETTLVIVALDPAEQSGHFSLSITDEPLLRSASPHVIRNQRKLGEVLTKATGLQVSQNQPYYEPETS
jgi:hypothetical protein